MKKIKKFKEQRLQDDAPLGKTKDLSQKLVKKKKPKLLGPRTHDDEWFEKYPQKYLEEE